MGCVWPGDSGRHRSPLTRGGQLLGFMGTWPYLSASRWASLGMPLSWLLGVTVASIATGALLRSVTVVVGAAAIARIITVLVCRKVGESFGPIPSSNQGVGVLERLVTLTVCPRFLCSLRFAERGIVRELV
jgi:hypothetical protein